MASRSINIYSPLTRPVSRDIFVAFHQVLLKGDGRRGAGKMVISHRNVVYSAIQESSTATVTDKKEAAPDKKEAPEKPKRTAPAKAPVKALPLLMEEDVIPLLKATLEAHADISQIELSFNDNTLEGSFVKKAVRYYFWAFFPDGVLTGPKGFALSSSYETEVSTIEPFLIDEKKITATQVVFWVEKRLAAQGILPVWND